LIKQCEAEVDMMARIELDNDRAELDITEDDIDNWFSQGL
jgi:general stress protein 26